MDSPRGRRWVRWVESFALAGHGDGAARAPMAPKTAAESRNMLRRQETIAAHCLTPQFKPYMQISMLTRQNHGHGLLRRQHLRFCII